MWLPMVTCRHILKYFLKYYERYLTNNMFFCFLALWLSAYRCFDHDLPVTEERVSVGTERLCSKTLQGQMWFNPLSKGLYLCDGTVWITVLEGENLPSKHPLMSTFYSALHLQKSYYFIYSDHKRLDYVSEHQVLPTSSETHDIEVYFYITSTLYNFNIYIFLFCCTAITISDLQAQGFPIRVKDPHKESLYLRSTVRWIQHFFFFFV